MRRSLSGGSIAMRSALGVVGAGLRYLAWVLAGAVASYGALYAFSPFGIGILAMAAVLGIILWQTRPAHDLSAWGVVAGPSVLCFLVARYADSPGPWLAAGIGFVAASLAGLLLTERLRLRRG